MSRLLDLDDDDFVIPSTTTTVERDVAAVEDTTLQHFAIKHVGANFNPDLRAPKPMGKINTGILPMIAKQVIDKRAALELVEKYGVYMQPCLYGERLTITREDNEITAIDRDGYYYDDLPAHLVEKLLKTRVDFSVDAILNDAGLFVADVRSYDGSSIEGTTTFDRLYVMKNLAFTLGIEKLPLAMDTSEKTKLFDSLYPHQQSPFLFRKHLAGVIFKPASAHYKGGETASWTRYNYPKK